MRHNWSMQWDNVISFYLIKYKQALFHHDLNRIGGRQVQGPGKQSTGLSKPKPCAEHRDRTEQQSWTHMNWNVLWFYIKCRIIFVLINYTAVHTVLVLFVHYLSCLYSYWCHTIYRQMNHTDCGNSTTSRKQTWQLCHFHKLGYLPFSMLAPNHNIRLLHTFLTLFSHCCTM